MKEKTNENDKMAIKSFVQEFRKEAMIRSLNGELGNTCVETMDLLNEFEKNYLKQDK